MATTEYLPVAVAVGANVEPQANFAGSSWQQMGFVTGVAKSAQANKVWRQASMMSAGWANLIVNILGQNVPDDGNLNNLVSQLYSCVNSIANTALNASGLLARVAALEALTTTHTTQINGLLSSVASLQSMYNALAQRVTTNEGNINNLTISLNSLWVQYTALQQRVSSIDSSLGQLWTAFNALSGTVSNQETQIQALMPTGSLATNGWCELPNGLIIQWCVGTFVSSAAQVFQTVAFPRPFPNGCFNVQVSTQWSSGDNADVGTWQSSSWDNGNVYTVRARSSHITVPQNSAPVIFAVGF